MLLTSLKRHRPFWYLNNHSFMILVRIVASKALDNSYIHFLNAFVPIAWLVLQYTRIAQDLIQASYVGSCLANRPCSPINPGTRRLLSELGRLHPDFSPILPPSTSLLQPDHDVSPKSHMLAVCCLLFLKAVTVINRQYSL